MKVTALFGLRNVTLLFVCPSVISLWLCFCSSSTRKFMNTSRQMGIHLAPMMFRLSMSGGSTMLPVRYCECEFCGENIDICLLISQYPTLTTWNGVSSNVEVVSATVPQTQRQDPHNPWHTWTPPSQEDTRSCQWGGYYFRREDKPGNPGVTFSHSVTNLCFSGHFFL